MQHYLDYASTSPLRPVAIKAMTESFELLGDPSRIHNEGMEARYAIEKAREEVADFLDAKPREVIFTSGATESIATAIFGIMEKNPGSTLLTSAVEHSAVLEACQKFPHSQIGSQIGVDNHGVIDMNQLESALSKNTKNISLVSIQHANHEIGTLQDIETISTLVKEANPNTLIHIDAAQSVGHIPFSFSESQADLVSISSHKFGGPKGSGVLLTRKGLKIPPLLLGGSQERARRGGMENTTAIIGLGATCHTLNNAQIETEAKAARELTQLAIDSCSGIDGITHYGHPEKRAPQIACFGVAGVEPQAILLELNRKGVSVHSGSACASEDLQPSTVLEAIGVDASRSLRLSVGWNSTQKDIQAFVTGLQESLDYLRNLMG